MLIFRIIVLWSSVSLFLNTPVSYAQNFADIRDAEALNEEPFSNPNVSPQIHEGTTTPEGGSPPGESFALPNQPLLEDSSTYTLGIYDVIEITVLRHPEVSGQFTVNNEGKIQYQFVGDVEVIGKTKDEVRAQLLELLSNYIISPQVTVKIVGYNSKVVYVIGEVGHPGKIYMRGDTITVHEALVQSGLPLLSASTKKCRLITPSMDGRPQQKIVNVFALLYEGDLRENLVMKPGDTLYVPATVLAKAMRVIQPVAQPVSTAAGTARPFATGGF